MKQHKWAKEIKAWADGAEIEFKDYLQGWMDCKSPAWSETATYRIKPQLEKPDSDYINIAKEHYANLRKYEKKLWEQVCVEVMNDFIDGMKPEPKEPKYLYAFRNEDGRFDVSYSKPLMAALAGWKYIGKIKLETEE